MDEIEETLKSLIKTDVMSILNVTEEKAEQLASSLITNEIGSMSNLNFVKEDEIKEFVGLYNARKLISVWSTRGARKLIACIFRYSVKAYSTSQYFVQ